MRKYWAARGHKQIGPYESREQAISVGMIQWSGKSFETGYGEYGAHFDLRGAGEAPRLFPRKRREKLTKNPTKKRRAVRRKKSDPRRFTRKANTPKKRRQWKHVYRSERARGLAKPRAIRAADSVIKRETVKRNPRPLKPREHIIQAFVTAGAPVRYWNGNNFFDSDRKYAHVFKTSSGAMTVAKELMKRAPKTVRAIQVIPA